MFAHTMGKGTITAEGSCHDVYFWSKYDIGQKYHAPQVRLDKGSNS